MSDTKTIEHAERIAEERWHRYDDDPYEEPPRQRPRYEEALRIRMPEDLAQHDPLNHIEVFEHGGGHLSAAQRWLPNNADNDSSPLIATLMALRGDDLRDEDAAEIAADTFESAFTFARALGHRDGSVGPTSSGELMFEWDLPGGLTASAHAMGRRVTVTLFDDERDLIDMTLAPRAAAQLLSAALSGLS